MTLQNQARPWRVCLFLTAAVSVNSQLHLDSCHGVSGGGQPTRKEPVLCRGGSRSSFPRQEQQQPPPPPPRPVSKKKEKQQQQQQGRFWSGPFIPPPPPHQPSGVKLSHAQQPQRNDVPPDKSTFSKLTSPPSHLDSESHPAAWRPPPPPPLPRTNGHVRNCDPRHPAPPVSRPGNARQQQQQVQRSTVQSTPESSSSSTREDLVTAHDPAFVLLPEGGIASVGDRRNGPFVPRPNNGGVFAGKAPFVSRPNHGSASVSDKWSSPSSMDPIDNNLDTDVRTAFPPLDWKALATADFILVSPENVEQLDRISLKTGIRPKEDRRDDATLGTSGNLVHLRHHHELVLEQLLQSQESIREEMVAIAQLLRALLVAVVRQNDHSSLVPHVPRHLTRVVAPRIARRRRVERRRRIPRRTILSTLEDLDRDLSDGEFHDLLHGLMQPSEVEEVYHEYEYDQEEDFLPQEQQLYPPKIHISSNQEEFNEFLRETSDSETAEQYYEQDQYDSDFSYDYYNDEPLDELWDEDSLTDMAVGELTKGGILHSDKDDVEMLVRDPKSGFSFELASREENHVLNNDVCDEAPETSSQRNEISEANGPKDSIMRAGTSASRRPPPPPPRHHSTKGHSHWQSDETRIRPPVHCTLPTGAGVRTAKEGPKKPPQPPPPRVPPDRYRMTPLPPISKLSLEVVDEESAWSDQSDDLDQDEVRLLEDTAINEINDRMRDEEEEIEDYEDGIDEDDFRILQLSRWTPPNGGKRSRWAPFSGRKKRSFDDEEEDLFVDEAIYLDEALYDAMTTDDFTDIEGDTPALPASLAEDDESSEDDMILGESAVTDIPGYTENHFGDPKLNSNAPLAHHGNAHFRLVQPPPPPPRPPPWQASVHNASKMHPAIQQPHVQQALQPQLARATGQSTHYEVYPPYSSQQRELYDRPMSHAAASHSSHVTGNPNTHTNPQLHNARDTWHPNGDAEKSQYKR